jgi:N-acylglucosamine 2-epimerase
MGPRMLLGPSAVIRRAAVFVEARFMTRNPSQFAELYRDNLLNDVVPFWEKHSLDQEHGGYFTCIDRSGNVYDTDKFVWLQARQVWTFSMLYRKVEPRPEWLEIARLGAEFLAKHGMDDEGNWYFSLTREGRPLIQPYNWFSDCFAAMGFAQYALASGDAQAADIALRTFRNLLRRKDNPKGKYTKQFPGTRPLKSQSIPMILINVALEAEGVVPDDEVQRIIDDSIREVMTLFYDPGRGFPWDNVAPDGSHPDCFEGRAIMPGHGIETMWLTIEAIRRRGGDRAVIDQCVDAIVNLLEFGWDQRDEGIFYYRDIMDKPPQQLEWDQKLWWVHIETLVALTIAWAVTKRKDCGQWYERVHDYTWRRFPDAQYGEWFGYLDRRGEPLLDLKGGKWKGCYHVPRGLYLCRREFEAMTDKA